MRLTVDPKVAAPEFVSAFLSGLTGRAQIERDSRQIIGMTNINAEEIRALRIKLTNDMATQAALLATLDTARATHNACASGGGRGGARGARPCILGKLGLTLGSAPSTTQPFAVHLPAIRQSRVDAEFHSPRFRRLREQIEAGPRAVHSLTALYAHRWCPALPLAVKIRPRLLKGCHICALLISQRWRGDPRRERICARALR